MEKSKVEFVYKNISSLNKISIVNKKIFRILPYICVPSLAIGGIAVFLKEMLPIKGVLPNYIRLVCLVIFFLTSLKNAFRTLLTKKVFGHCAKWFKRRKPLTK